MDMAQKNEFKGKRSKFDDFDLDDSEDDDEITIRRPSKTLVVKDGFNLAV